MFVSYHGVCYLKIARSEPLVLPDGSLRGCALMQSAAIDFSRQPIAFTHIPKTAGTTVSTALEAAFPNRNLFQLQQLEPEALRHRLADRSIHAYCGHLRYLQLSAAFGDSGRQPLYIAVLREPIERILSAYSYAKDTPAAKRWHGLAAAHDINGFISVVAENHRHFLVGMQCRFVGAVRGADADQALASLRANYAVIGLQSDLEGFFRRLEARLEIALPRQAPLNQSRSRIKRDSLNKKSLRILERTTREDRRLYELVVEWLGK
ncbi:MAG TPA: sulfotransferase family 2 domain-containing protein [Kiloniellaceae bacterium]|nr:sulfotransferase family 2 domain-containing protein [Kiloniellaceae bacterium]